jgi:hypothetical protein
MTIAKTIYSQLKTLDPMAMFAWGAQGLTDTGKGLQFKTTGMTPFKGYVRITLDEGKDLYVIEFLKVIKKEVKVLKTIDDVYAEDMIGIIDSYVG